MAGGFCGVFPTSSGAGADSPTVRPVALGGAGGVTVGAGCVASGGGAASAGAAGAGVCFPMSAVFRSIFPTTSPVLRSVIRPVPVVMSTSASKWRPVAFSIALAVTFPVCWSTLG